MNSSEAKQGIPYSCKLVPRSDPPADGQVFAALYVPGGLEDYGGHYATGDDALYADLRSLIRAAVAARGVVLIVPRALCGEDAPPSLLEDFAKDTY